MRQSSRMISVIMTLGLLLVGQSFQVNPTLLGRSNTLHPSPQSNSRIRKHSQLNVLPTLDFSSAFSVIDAFYKTQPYEAAFVTCGVKASAADLLAQSRESKDNELSESDKIEVERNVAFILYGGLYQGCAQYYIFNIIFPFLFGNGNDIASVAVKVAFDMLVVSPLLCLPIAYLTKAAIYGESWLDGLNKYKYDLIEKNLLLKYWSIWVPTQTLTFSVIPEHLRIAFIALVSFFWLIILSTIASADMESEEADADAGSQMKA